MKDYLTLLLFFIFVNAYSQKLMVDTTFSKSINSAEYFKKTDFLKVDALQLWNYTLDMTYHGRDTDSTKPIGRLTFWRAKLIYDSLFKHIHKSLWTPAIVFKIFSISDTNYCYKQSRLTRLFSSCVPPDVGGDMIIIDKYIFLNDYVCLDCRHWGTDVDYCRPVINYVFSNLDRTKITTIQSLVQQFVIAKRE